MSTTPASRIGNRPGPKPRLSREEIVEAALDVGVERLSVAAVAARLGVAPGTLYRYVGGLDEIATAAVEQVFARTPLPAVTRGWRPFLEDEAELRFALLVRYSGVVRRHGAELVSLAGRRMDRIAHALVGEGFGWAAATRVADAVLDIVADGATQTLRLRDDAGPDGLSEPARTMLASFSREVRDEVTTILDDPWAHVRDKVALVLDGVEHRGATGAPGYPPP